MGSDFQNPGGREHRVGMHVVIGRSHGLLAASHATSRKLPDLNLGLGIQGNPKRSRLLGRLRVNVLQVLEDRVGFGNFFSGRALRTRRSR